jgi:hypothetical protein
MGYDLHITRAEQWTESEQLSITADEWLAYVATDPELRLAGYNGPYFALWSGPSKHPDPWFDWSRGCIETKNPDPPLIAKAIAIAHRLQARVLGDDGEAYLPNGQIEVDGAVDDGPGMDWRAW